MGHRRSLWQEQSPIFSRTRDNNVISTVHRSTPILPFDPGAISYTYVAPSIKQKKNTTTSTVWNQVWSSIFLYGGISSCRRAPAVSIENPPGLKMFSSSCYLSPPSGGKTVNLNHGRRSSILNILVSEHSVCNPIFRYLLLPGPPFLSQYVIMLHVFSFGMSSSQRAETPMVRSL